MLWHRAHERMHVARAVKDSPLPSIDVVAQRRHDPIHSLFECRRQQRRPRRTLRQQARVVLLDHPHDQPSKPVEVRGSAAVRAVHRGFGQRRAEQRSHDFTHERRHRRAVDGRCGLVPVHGAVPRLQ